MRALFITTMLPVLVACGSAPRPATVTAQRARPSALGERIADQESTIRELEGRLALAQGEARDLRFEMERAAVRPTEPVTIGSEREREDWQEPGEWGEASEADPEEPEEAAQEPFPAEESSGPRPVLRLYGVRSPGATEPIPMLPAASAERLPVTETAPLARDAALPFAIPAPRPSESVAPPPFLRPGGSAPPFAGDTSGPRVEDVSDRYRDALRAFRDRRFQAALDLLDRIVQEDGDHPLYRHARYWRAEALYSIGAYARARGEFEAILLADPHGEKTPYVLLKLGLCHMRLGARGEARRFFDRLRTEFPSSAAVRLIEEGST